MAESANSIVDSIKQKGMLESRRPGQNEYALPILSMGRVLHLVTAPIAIARPEKASTAYSGDGKASVLTKLDKRPRMSTS